MSLEVYKQLSEVMTKRGGDFLGMDIPEFYALVEVMFTPEEAEVNNALPMRPVTVEDMAELMNKGREELEPILEAMANKGLCLAVDSDGTQFYEGARFMPGMFEFMFMAGGVTARDKKLAKLLYDYRTAYRAVIPKDENGFPTYRVITVDRTIDPDKQVQTHDQVRSYVEESEYISVTQCFCRHAALLRGEDIHGIPNDVCMQFGAAAQFTVQRLGGRLLTKEEAMDVLKRSEEAGLIHMSSNTAEGNIFICNCDRWHCGAVKTALSMSKPGVFFNSGFDPIFDPDRCIACETCIERCPSEALTMGEDDVPVVDFDRCFGCAVCATGCEDEAISMANKPNFRGVPLDSKALEEAVNTSLQK